jgi:glycosyltransferase involved in cell wall biosynthesis
MKDELTRCWNIMIRAASIAQNGLTNLLGWLSKLAYQIYQVERRSEERPFAYGRSVRMICRVTVKLLQKLCEALLVLFLYPESRYNPINQRLLDKKREIAMLLTGVEESKLTRALRDLIERNNATAPNAKPATATHCAINSGFGIVIPFYRHLGFLQGCLQSVAAAAEWLTDTKLSVVIVNDDPAIGETALELRIPAELKPVTQVLANKNNVGISRTLNRGILASSQPWLLLLDCDDKIHPTCFKVLSCAIRENPAASGLSSQMMYIDDQDQFLAYRFRFEKAPDLAENMYASHLKVFRRDIFDEIGLHNPQYDGCQDYELALRAAIQKRIHLLPDFLYFYRWHRKTQSVAANARQNAQRKKISQVYRLVVCALTSGKMPVWIGGSGPFRDSWLNRLPHRTSSASLSVTLAFNSDWTHSKMIYLLADVLGVLYSRHLEGNHAPYSIALPADYLHCLRSSCCGPLTRGAS